MKQIKIPSFIFKDNDGDILKIDEAETTRNVMISFIGANNEEKTIRYPVEKVKELKKYFTKFISKYEIK